MNLFKRLFSTKTTKQSIDFTSIIRMEDSVKGFFIPCFIHNINYHYSPLQMYSDGLISCWGTTDWIGFKGKLNSGWVTTSIPDGTTMSISFVGEWEIEQGRWQHTATTFYDNVYELFTCLNPNLQNLYQHQSNKPIWEDSKISVKPYNVPTPKPYHMTSTNRILGEKFVVFFRHSDQKTYIADLCLYPNKRVEISNLPTKQIIEFGQLVEFANKGLITTQPQIGETVTIANIGSFKIKSGQGIKMDYKLAEWNDKLNELNGSENSRVRCARIFEEYKQNPTNALKNKLKIAYESIPVHLRAFVGSIDTKDYEVRLILYGDIAKKEFEERYGMKYPYDDMPLPKD
ncbi:MAG: hypothetical protein JNM36_05360 [Chitinophagales bacterium]|nr:hypothetical protein [Chitinophagales bacterium]